MIMIQDNGRLIERFHFARCYVFYANLFIESQSKNNSQFEPPLSLCAERGLHGHAVVRCIYAI